MKEGLKIAAYSMEKNNKYMGIIANNLANLNTVGYKRDISFSKILGDLEKPTLMEYTDYKQGEALQTDNPLDLALNGDVFFVVEKEDGLAFTRNGKFKISNDGYLVDEAGSKVMGKDGEITIKENMLDNDQLVTITKEGEIKVGNNSIDELLIVKNENFNELTKAGNCYYKSTNDQYTEAEAGDFEVLQGFVENSNVNAVEEMESMIKIAKNYESSQKIVNYMDQVLEKVNDIGSV